MPPRKKAPPPPEPTSRTKEGFADGLPDLRGVYLGEAPDVFNGLVKVYRYRVTVERIEEPREVIEARMMALYRATDNHHERTALSVHARRIGFDLQAALEKKP